jgi:hypothetical protein
MLQTIFDAWVSRREINRPPRSWKKGEIVLSILETCGDPPPGRDSEPPDHDITLAELIEKSREPESPEKQARREEERCHFDLEEHSRVLAVKKAAHRAAWIEFKRQHDLDLPPAA